MPETTYRKDYLPPAWWIDTIELHVDLHDDTDSTVQARLVLRRNPEYPQALSGENRQGARPPLVLNGGHLQTLSLVVDGHSLVAGVDYYETADTLTLHNPPADAFLLDSVVHIRPQDNTALEGLYRSGRNFCTQCEAEGFRRITWFVDRPDVMARYTVTIEADAARYPVLLSNGNPVASGAAPEGRHWVRWHDPFPKPSYLFALVAGPLMCVADHFTTRSGRDVALRLYVESGHEHLCDHALRSLKKAMAWDEQVYGFEYDLDVYMIVAVGDFNMGAMENKGLNIFNTKYILASPEIATDSDFLGVESVVSHEYFHNWTGNRITCRDWFQLSLKEGLTVFRDQCFSADVNSPAVERIDNVRGLRGSQFPEDAGTMAHPVRPDQYIEINNFYTPTVYEKGAEVVRMLHTRLGPAGFRRGIDLYVQRHDGQAVTCDAFVAAMADANHCDLSPFLRWYAQAGTPELRAEGRYNAVRQCYHLTVRQHTPPTPGQPDKLPLPIPLALGLLGPDGCDLPLRLEGEDATTTLPPTTSRVLLVDRAEMEFVFTGLTEPPVPSLLRGFSAPVRLVTALDETELAFLVAHDSDPFNRWEAGQTLATRLLLGLVDAFRAGQPLALPETCYAAMARLWEEAQNGADPAFAALALTLPSEQELGQHRSTVDVDGIHAVRQFARRALAERLRTRIEACYQACQRYDMAEVAFSLEPQAMGRRSLKNLALAYLMALDDVPARALCQTHYTTATTMTERIGALRPLVDSDGPERTTLLADFYQRWQAHPLVVDKWLALQAVSCRSDTPAAVAALIRHPAFDRNNPNKVYALLRTFASENPVGFHAADGLGYRLVAMMIRDIDPRNPQVASRLAKAFTRWRSYDVARQVLMLQELRGLAAAPLSPDVGEIVSRSLEGAEPETAAG